MTPRHLDSPTVFLMEVVLIADLPEKKVQHYPRYRVCTYSEAITNTLEEAERLIGTEVSRRKGIRDEQVFCYYVTEKPLGMVIYRRDYISKRMYNAEGSLLEKSYCSSSSYTDSPLFVNTFYGHPEDAVRFQTGDIVEVYRGNDVSLAVVASTPPSVERCWNIFSKHQKRGDFYPFDDTDDVYTVINGPDYGYHEHISPLNVFTPHFPIPPQMERRMKGYLDKMDK